MNVKKCYKSALLALVITIILLSIAYATYYYTTITYDEFNKYVDNDNGSVVATNNIAPMADIGNGTYCGLNQFNKFSIYANNDNVKSSQNSFIFKDERNNSNYFKMQLRNGYDYVKDIYITYDTGYVSIPFTIDNDKINVISFGLNGRTWDTLIYFNLNLPHGTYYIRFDISQLTSNYLVIKEIMITSNEYSGVYEPYFQSEPGMSYELNKIYKPPYDNIIPLGYFALPTSLPFDINFKLNITGIDLPEESYLINVGGVSSSKFSEFHDTTNRFLCEEDIYTDMSLSSLKSRYFDYYLLSQYSNRYIVIYLTLEDSTNYVKISNAVKRGDIQSYIIFNSITADSNNSFNDGYTAGFKDGNIVKQNDALGVFPSFFGAIGDFFRKFFDIQIFGFSLGSMLLIVVTVVLAVSLLKMFR